MKTTTQKFWVLYAKGAMGWQRPGGQWRQYTMSRRSRGWCERQAERLTARGIETKIEVEHREIGFISLG